MLFAKFMLRVFLKNPELRRISRWRILLKITVVIVTDLLQVAITWWAMKHSKDPQTTLLALQTWMSAIVNLAITQHYLITLSVQAHYHLLNIELRQVIDECRMLSFHPQRRGAFMTRCCSLADQVENIAKFQSQLQLIVNHLDVFGIEGLILYGGYYILSIAAAYMIYSIFNSGHESLQMTFMSMIISSILCFFYYMDAILDLKNKLNLLDDHETMLLLLEERTLFAHTLDVRLEQTVSCFWHNHG
ncbi:putative gustatory receptor 36a [Drosophila subpulchrella]|uniref:putative gustatory receptor 36a n=1 Tax=Drosophila subpulchrella TaxID=1486046 RepID=UPI0018A1991A|nr:putative gustatory receptor 36a [Drosophila subpulchrella]